MKIRIRGNSIRFRLTRGDVDTFAKTGTIKETIHFGAAFGGQLTYRLQRANVSDLTSNFSNGEIIIEVPNDIATQWTNDQTFIGLEHLANAESEQPLRILVEKDFKCLQVRKDEDESDAFPNPKGKEEPDASI